MNQLRLLLSGPPDGGKTFFAAGAFDVLDPSEIIHIDNHGSTNGYGLPVYGEEGSFGVKRINFEEAATIPDLGKKIFKKDSTFDKIKLVIIDDLTEFDQVSLLDEEEEFEGRDKRQLFGAHRDNMARGIRWFDAAGISYILIARSTWGPDPDTDTPPPKQDGDVDRRPMMHVPMLIGQFQRWVMHQVDVAAYLKFDHTDGGPAYYMQLERTPRIFARNRLSKLREGGARMEDPSFR